MSENVYQSKDVPTELDRGELYHVLHSWAKKKYGRDLSHSELVYLQELSWSLIDCNFSEMINSCNIIKNHNDTSSEKSPNEIKWFDDKIDPEKILKEAQSNILSNLGSAQTLKGSIRCIFNGHKLNDMDKKEILGGEISSILTTCITCKIGIHVDVTKRKSGKYNYNITEL